MKPVPFTQRIDQTAGDTSVIPHLIYLYKATIIFYPDDQSPAWLATQISLAIALGEMFEPFGRAFQLPTVHFTAESDSDESRAANKQLMRASTDMAMGRMMTAVEKYLSIAYLPDLANQPTSSIAVLDSLREAMSDGHRVVVIDDVRPLLPSSARDCDSVDKLDYLFSLIERFIKSGNAAVMFIPYSKSGLKLDVTKYFPNAIQIRLSQDIGGARDHGASLLISRMKAGILDNIPTEFRLYCAIRGGEALFGWDLPDATDAPEERRMGRANMIAEKLAENIPKVDIARILELDRTTVWRHAKKIALEKAAEGAAAPDPHLAKKGSNK